MRELTLGSLFSGSGGFEKGAVDSGIKPIWNSEIEPFALLVERKHFPFVKNLGDIRLINGGEIESVDIVTFGSPCQDMSIAGKRAGLMGSRSSLFYEAVRIVKEMRRKTNGEYPRFVVWENVRGAFSSNAGEDFRRVLESIIKIKDEKLHVPMPKKWESAGLIVGEGVSLSWRVLDSQYWGVPQRRKRIYLVADFRGESADKILFECQSLSRDSRESHEEWKGDTEGTRGGTRRASTICLNDQGGERMDVTVERTNTLIKSHPPLVFENHGKESRYTGPVEVAPTVLSSYGTGGNNQSMVVERECYDVRFTSEGTKNVRAHSYKSDTSRSLDTQGNVPSSNQGGVVVVEPRVEERGVRRRVRRLTPSECALLQGFPREWCKGLENENPTESEMEFWRGVFNRETRKKSDGAIRRWLKAPYSDSAEYKLWGNGVALPCVEFVLSGIKRVVEEGEENEC